MRGFFCEPRKPFFPILKRKISLGIFGWKLLTIKKHGVRAFFIFYGVCFFGVSSRITNPGDRVMCLLSTSAKFGTFLTSSTSAKFKTLPKFSLLKFSLPKFSLPKFSLPKFSLPKFSLPKFSLPKFSLPKFSLLKFSLLKLFKF